MGFAKGYNELQAKIHYQKVYIETLINFHPLQLDNWLQEEEQKFRCVAREYSEGDKEVEYSMMACQQTMLDVFKDGKYVFYNSMLLIVYSYYESMINHIAKSNGVTYRHAEPTIRSICKQRYISLTEELDGSIEYIKKNVAVLRNQIAHNNDGTMNGKAEADLRNLIAAEDDIGLHDGQVQINGISFICRILEMEYNILMYIAQNIDKTTQL